MASAFEAGASAHINLLAEVTSIEAGRDFATILANTMKTATATATTRMAWSLVGQIERLRIGCHHFCEVKSQEQSVYMN